MAGTNNTESDPKELQKAAEFWHGFMKFGKVFTVIIIAVLLLMALFLV